MFNIGDEVTVDQDYPITQVGDIGTIIAIEGPYYRVKFHTIARSDFQGYTFEFRKDRIVLVTEESVFPTAVSRKIAAIYARQYRKTGYACFL